MLALAASVVSLQACIQIDLGSPATSVRDCPSAEGISAAVGFSVTAVPGDSIFTSQACDYRNDGSVGELSVDVPAVQVTSAPIESDLWSMVSVDRAIQAGRLTEFDTVGAGVARGGQYHEANISVMWIDEPKRHTRNQIWISYGKTSERPTLQKTHEDIEEVALLFGLAAK